MNPEPTSISRRALARSAVAALVAGLSFSATQMAQALPYYRGVARRTARRTTRRVVRRHCWALPGPYRPFRWGAYSYFLCGGLYYYPYMMSGRTVYVQVEVDGAGHPLPPPPPSEINIDIDID